MGTDTSGKRYNYEELRTRVVYTRKRLKLTQEDMADKLGLTRGGYGHYESGRQQFDIEQLVILSEILCKPVTYLLGIETTLDEPQEELLHAFSSIRSPVLRDSALESVKRLAEDDKKMREGI